MMRRGHRPVHSGGYGLGPTYKVNGVGENKNDGTCASPPDPPSSAFTLSMFIFFCLQQHRHSHQLSQKCSDFIAALELASLNLTTDSKIVLLGAIESQRHPLTVVVVPRRFKSSSFKSEYIFFVI
ncbi:hypothetical protein L2E82_35603 [Cichorium intybus]|uniref:Uncharacterized protein n=1 Tax=Cichorium intybus TaxID=13427 RepID=A0ACB9BP78_CICIN|nr:hypothetical protein L2E82_35603 [Cichorium intybus]